MKLVNEILTREFVFSFKNTNSHGAFQRSHHSHYKGVKMMTSTSASNTMVLSACFCFYFFVRFFFSFSCSCFLIVPLRVKWANIVFAGSSFGPAYCRRHITLILMPVVIPQHDDFLVSYQVDRSPRTLSLPSCPSFPLK